MQWKNPDGSITEGVVIEDGDGNKITSFSSGGGGGGTVTQGPAGSAAAPWYVAPGTGVAWTLGGALPAFAATPTFNIGTAPTLAVNWSGQSVAVSNFPATQAVSIASLPALSAGSNVVGGVTQSGGPWTVSWSGQSVAATQSGTWNVSLAAGSNTVGNVGVNNNPVGSAGFAASQASIGTAAAQIVAARAGRRRDRPHRRDALQRGLGHGLFRRQRRHHDDGNAASRRRFGDHQHAGRDLRDRRQRNSNHRHHGDLLMRTKLFFEYLPLLLGADIALRGQLHGYRLVKSHRSARPASAEPPACFMATGPCCDPSREP